MTIDIYLLRATMGWARDISTGVARNNRIIAVATTTYRANDTLKNITSNKYVRYEHNMQFTINIILFEQ